MGKDHYLLEAARNNDIKTVGKLLEQASKRNGPFSSFRRSPSINCQDVNGYTPLHHACLNGHSCIVRLLLEHHAQIDVPDVRGSTPLFLASWAGHSDIVKMLLYNSPMQANPNSQTIENETPLHSGAQHGHNTVVAILLSFGADPSIRNNSFQTPLDLAAQFGRLAVVQTLLKADPDQILQYRRYQENDVSDLLGYTVQYAATPTKHIFTHTCLHLASRNGHKKVVETLLAAGVDVNILTNAGSALHEAALCGKKSVVVALLKAGIDINATDGNGRTALEILSDYPPHVTYEIVAVINEFKSLSERALHTQLASNLTMENGAHSLPKRLFEKNTQCRKPNDPLKLRNSRKQVSKFGPSHSLSSLDNYTMPLENYLEMKPVKCQKSVDDIRLEEWTSYKPVYEQPYRSAFVQAGNSFSNGSVPSRSYEFINLRHTGSSSEERSTNSSSVISQRPESLYVEMALRSPGVEASNPPRYTDGIDSNNNNNNNKKINCHSPTPDYPPPTVIEAEATIFNYMRPLASDSTASNSCCSDQVEEFVGDMPFAGLFKGSTLNLDVIDGRGSSVAREYLRSPSMVRSVQRKSLSGQRYSAAGEDFSASRVLDEIDTIFEHIGNELLTVGQQPEVMEEEEEEEQPQQEEKPLSNERTLSSCLKASDSRQSLHIRNPAELLLCKSATPTSDWCHSPYTLVYGEIRYSVYYLGSTVIRQLQGKISARKSIQKLKIDENIVPTGSVSDISLLENCTTSTKYLKAANLQTRLKVDIAASSLGVKFIDHVSKNAICSHDIENINCVCQDAEDMRYFAYITKEQELYYCHVFMVDSLELANEIILTLGQAFEVAYQLAKIRQTDEC